MANERKKIHPTLVITFFKELSYFVLNIEKKLCIEVFKQYKIKETKPWLLPNQYLKSRENVIGGCAITRDECSQK
jgi:hypothetical protein